MSFLKRLTKDAFRDGSLAKSRSTFDTASTKQLEEHLRIARYGSFLLTEAVRPSMDLHVVPSAGWWVCAARRQAEPRMTAPGGTEGPVEAGARIWVKATAMDGR